jgi:regulator of ribosome biosynthesis
MTDSNPPRVDLANLYVEDPEHYDVNKLNNAASLQSIVEKNFKQLIADLFKLPTSVVDDTYVVALPPANTLTPREKIMPSARQPTKWESYAKTKGIETRKKSKLIWDEATQTWKPRFGYRRAENDKKKDWLVPVGANDDPNADPFAKQRNEKRERVSKNSMARQANSTRGKPKPTGANSLPMAPARKAAPSGIGLTDSKHKSIDEISRQASRARASTASVGKFQDGFKGEREPKNRAKKRLFKSNEMKVVDERENHMTVLRRALNHPTMKKARVDNERAANIHTAETQKAAHIDNTMNEQLTSVRRQSRHSNDKTMGKRKSFVGGFKQSSRTKRSQFFEHKQATGHTKTKGLRGPEAKAKARKTGGAGGGKAGNKKPAKAGKK